MAVATINGVEVHYEVEGSGKPLLFIHGLGSSGQDWHAQVVAFARDYHVIVYDVRGHGRTEKPAGPYSIEGFADDAAALLDHLQIEAVDTVGVSMGGMIALELAARHPDKVGRLVLVNTIPRVKKKLNMIGRWWTLTRHGLPGMAEYLAEELFPSEEHAELREKLRMRFVTNDLAAYKASTKAILRWNAISRLGDVKARTLIVSSDNDYWPVAEKEKYARMMPDARIEVVENAHHLLPVECPDRFNAKLAEFLRS